MAIATMTTSKLIVRRLNRIIKTMPSSMILPGSITIPTHSPVESEIVVQEVEEVSEGPKPPCQPCNAFNKISHITGLVQEASNSCTPDGLPQGVGGTIQVAAAECDEMINGLRFEPGFSKTVAALRGLRPKLSWVGSCEEAQLATEAALAARKQTHQDAVNYFRNQSHA